MYFLGVDIGTTGAKALLTNETGAVLGKGHETYRLISKGSHVEQNADDWIKGSITAIRQAMQNIDSSSVAAISLSAQGASTVAVDSQNRPLGNALTWMDMRASAEANELAEALGEDYIYTSTGWRINAALDAAKIMHIKRQKAYSGAVRFLSTLEYMNNFLTNNPVGDPSTASIRQLYSVREHKYDNAILDAAGILSEELPKIIPTGVLLGGLTGFAARETGLQVNTPVYNGAHDQYCASVGAGAIKKGDMLLSAGTTWVVMGIDDKPLFTDTYIAPGVHPISGLYGAMASLVGSGASMQWFKDNFLKESFEEINLQAAQRGNRTKELFFYPYLAGANYPIWKAEARGVFAGISLEHDSFDFARAIMEGAAFGVRRTLDDFAANGCKIKSLRMMGGAAKSEFWRSLIAACANVQVDVLKQSEACALGAAIIAAVGAGAYKSYYDAVKGMVVLSHSEQPEPKLTAELNEKYMRYLRMWDGIMQYYQ